MTVENPLVPSHRPDKITPVYTTHGSSEGFSAFLMNRRQQVVCAIVRSDS